MALQFEGNPPTSADIDDAGVLPGSQHHEVPLGGQAGQEPSRGLVTAVLGPHDTEDPEFRLVRLSPQGFDDRAVFGVVESYRPVVHFHIRNLP